MKTNFLLLYLIHLVALSFTFGTIIALIAIAERTRNGTDTLLGVFLMIIFLLILLFYISERKLISENLSSFENSRLENVMEILRREIIQSVINIVKFHSNKNKTKFRTKYSNLSIVGQMRLRLFMKIANGFAIIQCVLAIYISHLSLTLNIQPSLEVLGFTLVFILILSVYKFIVDFRVKNGFYGNNEREAREIIQFILEESQNIDFNDNGKLKKIISDDDVKKVASSKEVWYGRYN